MRVGAHLSITKGLDHGVELAAELGCNTFQYFTRNPRGGRAREIGADEIARGRAASRRLDVAPLVAHLPYTVNPASPDPQAYAFARQVVADDLRRAAELGSELVVCHPGSHGGDGPERGLDRVVALLESALDGAPDRPRLLLETMAGQGTEIGSDLGLLAAIIDRLGRPACLGICLDSCHLFAAGHDLRSPEVIDRLLEDIDRSLGLDRVGCLHLNDSKAPLGSRRDRHARIGEGHLGPDGIRTIVRHPFLRTLPLIVETPVDDVREYAREVRRARELAGVSVPEA